jgi:hypothetical protein
MTELKFEYKCTLDHHEKYCHYVTPLELEIEISITMPSIYKFIYVSNFSVIPLVESVDNTIKRLKEGDKFDKNGANFGYHRYNDEHDIDSMGINNNSFTIDNFCISLDLVREYLIDMFNTIKQKIDSCKKYELVSFLTKIYDYPLNNFPIIKKLDNMYMLIDNPRKIREYYDMTNFSTGDFKKMHDYIVDTIGNRVPLSRYRSIKIRKNILYMHFDYGAIEPICDLTNDVAKTNLLTALKSLF